MRQYLLTLFTWRALLWMIVLVSLTLGHRWWLQRKIREAVADRDGQWRRALSYDYQGDDFEEDPMIALCRREHAERMTGMLVQRVREVAEATGNQRGLALWKAVKRNILGGRA
jgi:hypothetical protein